MSYSDRLDTQRKIKAMKDLENAILLLNKNIETLIHILDKNKFTQQIKDFK